MHPVLAFPRAEDKGQSVAEYAQRTFPRALFESPRTLGRPPSFEHPCKRLRPGFEQGASGCCEHSRPPHEPPSFRVRVTPRRRQWHEAAKDNWGPCYLGRLREAQRHRVCVCVCVSVCIISPLFHLSSLRLARRPNRGSHRRGGLDPLLRYTPMMFVYGMKTRKTAGDDQ